MYPSILFRMILSELVKVFLLALVALTGLFLMAGLIQEAAQRGLPPTQVIAFIPLMIPNTLPWTIPATSLFATCVVYGRLSSDNEITAIRALGVNLLTILKPCLILGVVASGVTMFLFYDIIPSTHQAFKQVFYKDLQKFVYNRLKREHGIKDNRIDFAIYVRDVRGEQLIDAIFKKRAKITPKEIADGKVPGYEVVARAREAELTLDLPNRRIILDMDRCVVAGEKDFSGNLKSKQFIGELPPDLIKDEDLRASDLTWQEVLQRRVQLAEKMDQTTAEIDRLTEQGAGLPGAAETQKSFLMHYQDKMRIQYWPQMWSLNAELHARPAIALGCLCFVMVGCPVGIWFSRSDYLSSFVTCFLPTVFFYYPLLLCGGNLARDGKLPPVVTVWAADAIMVLIAVVLTWRLVRR
jgi:lipopolysaccharide export system permease protein